MKNRDLRQLIAHEAARLIANDGSLDYGTAKRKAAKQLRIADNQSLPDNQEIDDALRTYQSLYQGNTQKDQLSSLRQLALEYMTLLQAFDPHLTGPVLAGTAGQHSEINIQLFWDDEKELEFFLLNKHIDYARGEISAGTKSYPRFRIYEPRGTLELVLYPSSALGQLKRTQTDGSPRRVRLAQFKELLVQSPPC